MYRLVIFDLDGTLLNTLGDLAAAGNHALTAMSLPTHEVNAYRHFVGNGIPNLIHRILPEGHTEEQHQQCYDLFNEYYSVHKSDLTVPYEGICELVTHLDKLGIICCVNTNKAHEFASELVHSFFGDSITAVIGQGNGFPLKPSPDAALEFCRRYNIPKENTLYVGDSNVDMQTAHAAEIDSCGVLWGFRDSEELTAGGATYLAQNTEQLNNLINRQASTIVKGAE